MQACRLRLRAAWLRASNGLRSGGFIGERIAAGRAARDPPPTHGCVFADGELYAVCETLQRIEGN
jgi:hypothetical protein